MNYIPGKGAGSARLMIIGDCPTLHDVSEPFSGSSGRELDKVLHAAGINRSDLWLTNVSKYAVPPNQSEKKIPFHIRAQSVGVDLDEQIRNLRNEIYTINPNCILALGSTALWSLTGKSNISKLRGSILLGMGKKLVSTWNPADLIHGKVGGEIQGYWQKQIIIHDFKRAFHQSSFSELILPNRSLEICKSSYQLYDFIKRGNDGKLSIDIEASNCIPSCIGLAFSDSEALSVPLWNTHNFSNLSNGELTSIWILLGKVLSNQLIQKIGQNFKYDQDKIKRLGLPIDALYSDTMLKAFAINPELPKNLAFNTSIYTEEPYYKDEGMYEGSFEDLQIGNARDACVTWEIDTAMEKDLDELGVRDFYYNFIMKLHPLYSQIENEGFLVDFKKSEELLREYVTWSEKLKFELFQLTKADINVGSPKQVDILLYEELKIPRRKGTGEEVLTQLLNGPVKNPIHKKVIEVILEKRRVDKTISTYLLALPDYDGRMRTTYFLCLETGRTSTGQQEPPIRPIEEIIEIDESGKKKKKKKPLGIAFQTITKHGDIGPRVRLQYIADPGEVFIQADSSQAEARVVWLLADDEEALRLVDEIDYHALTASWFFGGTETEYSKKILGYESPIRFAGKTLRHAGHLGAQKRRAAISVNTDARKYKIPIQITEADAGRALTIFHQKQPKIKQIFQKGIEEALFNDRRILTAGLPFGIDSECGGKRIFYERQGDELLRQAFSYIPQRSISDNTKQSAIRIKQRASWIRILVEAHDALLLSIPRTRINEAAPIIKNEMERPISFRNCSLPRRDLIIPCELEIGDNYYEFSKFKGVDIVV